jgi:hypothetical protein
VIRQLGLGAAVAVIAVTAPANARETLELKPSSAWNLHYDADSCVLRRQFGEGEQLTYLEMRRFEPGTSTQFIVSTNIKKVNRTFLFRFDEDEEWRRSGGFRLDMSDGSNGMIFTSTLFKVEIPEALQKDPEAVTAYFKNLDHAALEEAAFKTVDGVMLQGAFVRDLTLRTGSLEGPVKAMRECTDELITHWGVDAEAHKTLSRPVTAKNAFDMGTKIEYPRRLVQKGVPGIVRVRLGVDPTGAVSGCHIQMDLADAQFEKEVCDTLSSELVLEPALDKDGNTVASYWVTQVTFWVGGTARGRAPF